MTINRKIHLMPGVDAIVRVLEAGGSVITDDMGANAAERFAVAAKEGGGHVTIRVTAMGLDALQKVAGLASGHVTFDFPSTK